MKEELQARAVSGRLCERKKHETNLIFRLLQLSQARCVFVLFLASAWEAALPDEVPLAASLVESVGTALVQVCARWCGTVYFLFRLPVAVAEEGEGEGSVGGCSWPGCVA
jgi:hypothetical protein